LQLTNGLNKLECLPFLLSLMLVGKAVAPLSEVHLALKQARKDCWDKNSSLFGPLRKLRRKQIDANVIPGPNSQHLIFVATYK
jgi:hypothetical protein